MRRPRFAGTLRACKCTLSAGRSEREYMTESCPDPAYWPLVVEEMKYLNPGEYLGNNSIDLYLLQHWVKEKDISPVLYLWIEAVIMCSRQEAPIHSVSRACPLPKNLSIAVCLIFSCRVDRHYKSYHYG